MGDMPGGGSSSGDFRGNAHQVSVEDSPATRWAHRAWLMGLLTALSFMAVIGGIQTVIFETALWLRIPAGVLTLAGIPLTVRLVRRTFFHFRALHRLRRDRCVHCGYATQGVRMVRCPECNHDPFEW